jgi:hypothetical protein
VKSVVVVRKGEEGEEEKKEKEKEKDQENTQESHTSVRR